MTSFMLLQRNHTTLREQSITMARFLRLLALFLALTVAVLADSDEQCVGGEGECAADEPVQTMTETEEDPKCPSRRHIIQCAGQYLDTNNNGKLDRSELQAAIDSLPWYDMRVAKEGQRLLAN